MNKIPFSVIDWDQLTASNQRGESGIASIRYCFISRYLAENGGILTR